jgi:hypothetical protein
MGALLEVGCRSLEPAEAGLAGGPACRPAEFEEGLGAPRRSGVPSDPVGGKRQDPSHRDRLQASLARIPRFSLRTPRAEQRAPPLRGPSSSWTWVDSHCGPRQWRVTPHTRAHVASNSRLGPRIARCVDFGTRGHVCPEFDPNGSAVTEGRKRDCLLCHLPQTRTNSVKDGEPACRRGSGRLTGATCGDGPRKRLLEVWTARIFARASVGWMGRETGRNRAAGRRRLDWRRPAARGSRLQRRRGPVRQTLRWSCRPTVGVGGRPGGEGSVCVTPAMAPSAGV